jgi:hypothetical protein
MVLEEGQTQLRFLHVNEREFSLSLMNSQMHRAKLEAVLPNRTIMQEGVPAWVDFRYPATRRDVMVEMIEGLTARRRPETAWLRRRLPGPMP